MDMLSARRLLDSGRTIYDLALRAVFYARVSTDRDEQINSLTNQVTYYEEFIRSKQNWTYAGAYIDEGISGTSTEKREEFLRMIEDARQGKFDLIVTKEISRFSRNTLDSIRYTRELLECGVGVFFQSDNINTLYSDAELRLTIMSSLAQDEVRRLSERVKFGMKRAYESGRVLGQDNMYGFDKKDGKLTVNEKEAQFIRALFSMYAEGRYGFRTIARILSESGYTNQSGGEINPGTLRNILQNPKYKGYYCGRKTESADYRTKTAVKLPEEERIYYRDENIPAIISEEMFDKVQVMLAARREKYKRNEPATQYRYPYSGKIVCERCGSYHYRIVHRDRKKNQEVWMCKTRTQKGKSRCPSPVLATEELDAIMERVGADLMSNRDQIVSSLLARYRRFQDDERDQAGSLIKLKHEVETLLSKKERLLEFSLDNTISKEEFIVMNERLDKPLQKARIAIANIEKEQAMRDDAAAQFVKLEQYLTKEVGKGAYHKEVARNLLERIVAAKDSTDQHLKLRLFLRHGEQVFVQVGRLNILDIETEVSPIVGSERESEELLRYLLCEFENDPGMIWDTNIFGKSLNELVREGLSNKLSRMPEDIQMKFQDTLQKIINEGSNGLICILL